MSIPNAKDCAHPSAFPLAVYRYDPQERIDPAARDFSEIVIIVGGHALRVSGGDSWLVTAGDVFVVGRHEGLAYRDIKDLRVINVLFSPERFHIELLDLSELPGYRSLFTLESSKSGGDARQKRVLRLSPKELSIAVNYAETLAHELKVKGPGFAFIACACFMQLVGYLSRAYSRSKCPDLRAQFSIRNAIGHLETHFDQPVNLNELSRLTHMSKRSFIRAFQAATGTTPIAYLGTLRLARAAAMLRRHEENVTSVALKVGYNDSNYFTRRFHAMFGVPPSEYRKRQELV
jgi:AraC-like DNA-binding protein